MINHRTRLELIRLCDSMNKESKRIVDDFEELDRNEEEADPSQLNTAIASLSSKLGALALIVRAMLESES